MGRGAGHVRVQEPAAVHVAAGAIMSEYPNVKPFPEPSLDVGPVIVEVAAPIAGSVRAGRAKQTIPARWHLLVRDHAHAEELSIACRDGIKENPTHDGLIKHREAWAALRRKLHQLVPQVCETCGDPLDHAALEGLGMLLCSPCNRERLADLRRALLRRK